MKLKNDEKSEEKLSCRFKIDIKNSTNFDSSTWKPQKFTLMGCFWPKYIMFDLKKYRGVMFDGTEYYAKFEGKLTLAF